MLRDGADDEMMLPHGVAARGICFAWEAGRGRGRDPHAARCRAPSRGVVEATDELTSQLLEDMENRVKMRAVKIRAVRIFIVKYINSLYALPAAHASALPHSLSLQSTHAHTTCMHAQRASDTQLLAHGERRDRLHRVHGRCWSKYTQSEAHSGAKTANLIMFMLHLDWLPFLCCGASHQREGALRRRECGARRAEALADTFNTQNVTYNTLWATLYFPFFSTQV